MISSSWQQITAIQSSKTIAQIPQIVVGMTELSQSSQIMFIKQFDCQLCLSKLNIIIHTEN